MPSPIKVAKSMEIIELTPEDQRFVAEILLNPPPPNPKLVKAIKNYLAKGFTFPEI